MDLSHTADAAHRAASAAIAGGASVSAGSGVAMYLSPGHWQVVGILGGLAIGLLGLIVNAAINFYFKSQELRLMRARLEANDAAD